MSEEDRDWKMLEREDAEDFKDGGRSQEPRDAGAFQKLERSRK